LIGSLFKIPLWGKNESVYGNPDRYCRLCLRQRHIVSTQMHDVVVRRADRAVQYISSQASGRLSRCLGRCPLVYPLSLGANASVLTAVRAPRAHPASHMREQPRTAKRAQYYARSVWRANHAELAKKWGTLIRSESQLSHGIWYADGGYSYPIGLSNPSVKTSCQSY
jgi:hypothetical protein